jgi:hypothetical protein
MSGVYSVLITAKIVFNKQLFKVKITNMLKKN